MKVTDIDASESGLRMIEIIWANGFGDNGFWNVKKKTNDSVSIEALLGDCTIVGCTSCYDRTENEFRNRSMLIKQLCLMIHQF